MMGRAPGARELELKAQRERQAKARECVTNRPTVAPMSSVGSGVERQAERASKRRLSEKEIDEIVSPVRHGRAPNIHDEQLAVVTDAIARLGPECPKCDTSMFKNPEPRGKTFKRAWLCPVCDTTPMEAKRRLSEKEIDEIVDDRATATTEATTEELLTEDQMAKKAKKAVKVVKKVKAKRAMAKVVKKVKSAVRAKAAAKHVNGGSKKGRPREKDSIESLAPWVKAGNSRRTFYRRQLAAK